MSVTPGVAILLTGPLTGRGPSYTCGMLARTIARQDLVVTIVTPRARSFTVFPANVIEVLPRWGRYLPYKWVRSSAERRLESVFLTFVEKPGSQINAAYIFADASIESIMELKRAKITVFREMIGIHRGTMKAILDEAYARLGVAPRHGITDASVALEQEALRGADYIFTSNPMVDASLLEHGVQPGKLLQASYGWDPARFSGSKRLLPPGEGIVAVFVGRISVAKGAHLLLDYWAKSGIKGRLVLTGEIEPLIKEKCAALLGRDDVVVLPYQENIGAVYRSADIFVFPTFAEGGPQVTYEACGCGLPVITTPMGAGRIVRDNQEGFVLDPYDSIGWISALRMFADNSDRRRSMADAAVQRAREFVWETVATQRGRQMRDILVPSI